MGTSFRRTDFWDSLRGQVLRLFKGILRHSLTNHCLHTISSIFYLFLHHTVISSKQNKVSPAPLFNVVAVWRPTCMILDKRLGENPHSFGVSLRFCQDDWKNRYFCNVCQVMTEGCSFVFKFHTRSSCYFSCHILRLWPCLCRCSTKKWIHGLGITISGVIRIHMGGLLESFLSQVRAYIEGMLYLPTTKAYEDTMVVYAIQSCDKRTKWLNQVKTWLITVHHFLKWMLHTGPSQLHGLRDLGLDV